MVFHDSSFCSSQKRTLLEWQPGDETESGKKKQDILPIGQNQLWLGDVFVTYMYI